MKLCCISNREAVFLFLDTQIIDSLFLEDINSLLHTGEVPNLFRNEDIQEVYFHFHYLMYIYHIDS
jgi:dynein heavy chain